MTNFSLFEIVISINFSMLSAATLFILGLLVVLRFVMMREYGKSTDSSAAMTLAGIIVWIALFSTLLCFVMITFKIQ